MEWLEVVDEDEAYQSGRCEINGRRGRSEGDFWGATTWNTAPY